MNFLIRQEQANDYAEVYQLVQRAFATTECDGDEQDYLNELRQKPGFIAELSLVAVTLQNKIVGQITLTETQLLTPDGSTTELLLSPISVDPDYFRQGIARLLIEASLKRAAKLGYRAVFLCGDPDFYQRVGFVPTYKRQIFHVKDIGRNADWCMVRELRAGALEGTCGEVDIV